MISGRAFADSRPATDRAESTRGVSRDGTILPVALLALLLAFFVVLQTHDVYSRDRAGGDFVGTILEPAQRVLEGETPYPSPGTDGFVSESVYPPAIFLAALPLALVPDGWATVIWQTILLVVAALTLFVLGVRDWRCYLIWLLSCPVVLAILFGNATLLVIGAAAVLWRWRDRKSVAAVALAVGVALKLFIAPFGLWLALTGRFRTCLYSGVIALCLIIAPWVALRFDGLRDYPDRLEALAAELGGNGILVQALVRQLGESTSVATVAGVASALICFALGTMRRDDDLASFTWFAFGAILLTPIAWIYYPGLLVIPLAVRYPRFGAAWILFAALWVSWVYTPLGWATAQLSVAVIALCTLLVLVTSRPAVRHTAAGTSA